MNSFGRVDSRKKYIIRPSFRHVIMLMLLYGAVVYFGMVAGYDIFAIYSFVVFCFAFIYAWNRHEIVKERAKLFLIAGIYIFAFSLLNNYPLSIRNLPIIYLCFLLFSIKTVEKAKEFIFGAFGIVGLLFAIVTIILNHLPGAIDAIVLNVTKTNNLLILSGLGGEASANAFVMSVGSISYMGNLLGSDRRLGKVVSLSAIAIIYYGIFLTTKRSFMLMVPAVFLVLFLIYMYYSGTKKRIILYVAIVPVAVIIYLCFFQNAVTSLLGDGGEGIDLNGRDALWGIAFSMIMRHPIMGNGLKSYDVYFNRFYATNWSFAGSHNSYIQYTAEMGIVFTVLFFAWCFKCVGNMIITYKRMVTAKVDRIEIAQLMTAIGIILVMFIYGLSGNPFNNPHQMLTGAIAGSCGIEMVRKYGGLKGN